MLQPIVTRLIAARLDYYSAAYWTGSRASFAPPTAFVGASLELKTGKQGHRDNKRVCYEVKSRLRVADDAAYSSVALPETWQLKEALCTASRNVAASNKARFTSRYSQLDNHRVQQTWGSG